MKVSYLISTLQKEQSEHGDIEVIVWEDDTCQHRKLLGVNHSDSENAIIINGEINND